MKRKITQWTLTMVLSITLVACATSTRYASTNDDIYYSPTKTMKASIATTAGTTIEDDEIAQLKRETQAAIKQNSKLLITDSTIVIVEDDGTYKSVLSDSYEDSYERRLRGYNSPSYGTESRIRIASSSDWMQITSYDPEFYNIIVIGDEVWVEPKSITNMFTPVYTTVNLRLNRGYYNPWRWDPFWDSSYYGWGWNSWRSPWYEPSYSWGWGWNSWYSPWYRPSYSWGWGWNCGWNGHWGYGGYYGGYYGHNHYRNNHWGLGRPTEGTRNTYGRRESGTLGQHRTSSATTRPSGVVDGSTRRGTRNMELVSNRQSTNGGNISDRTTAGNRRNNADVSNRVTGNNNVNNTTGRISSRDGRGNLSQNTTNTTTRTQATNQNSRNESQRYTRPVTASRQNYNQPTATGRTSNSGTSTNRTTTSSSNNNTYRQQVSGSSTSPSRSVSTNSRYVNNNSGSSSSNNNRSSTSTSRSSSSSSSSSSRSNSSYSSSSSSSSGSSYSPSSSSSSSRSSGSSSGSSSSSSGGGSRRR